MTIRSFIPDPPSYEKTFLRDFPIIPKLSLEEMFPWYYMHGRQQACSFVSLFFSEFQENLEDIFPRYLQW